MKESIIELSAYYDKNIYYKKELKMINTGSNKYTVFVEHINKEIKYSVEKRTKDNQIKGIINIVRVDEFGLVYDNTVSTLPDSVAKYIKKYNMYYYRYRNTGEKAFKNLK